MSNFQPSLRDFSVGVAYTQDCVLGYIQHIQPSLRDWHPLLLGNLEDGQAPHALSGRGEDGVRYRRC